MFQWLSNTFGPKLEIGDKVEFTVKVDIVMDGNCAWVRDPQYSQVMYGPFKYPGQEFRVVGTVDALSDFIHVYYNNWIPGFKPENTWSAHTNSFCCMRGSLTKIEEV